LATTTENTLETTSTTVPDPNTFVGSKFVVTMSQPPTWTRQLGTVDTHYSTTLGYLSSAALHDFCHPTGGGESCLWADLVSLAPNQLFVSVAEGSPTGAALANWSALPGDVASVDGYPAKRAVTTRSAEDTTGGTSPWPGGCWQNGGDESIVYTVNTQNPTDLVGIVACLRGPDLAKGEADLAAAVSSAHISQR
jgi:hypothetical protein